MDFRAIAVGGLLCAAVVASAAWTDGKGEGSEAAARPHAQCCSGTTLTQLPAGNAQCPNGGVQITSNSCGGHQACPTQTAVVCNGQSATNAAYTTGYQQGESIPLGTTPTTLLTLSVPAGSYVVQAKTVISGTDTATNHDVVCRTVTSLNEIDASVITPNHEVMSTLLGSFTTTVPETITFECYQTYAGNSTPSATFFELAAQQVSPLVQQP